MDVRTVRRVGRRYDLVVVVSLLWFMVQFLRFVFPPLFETFQADYGVSNTDVGVLFTLLMIAYSLVQFPAGALSDRFGRPSIMLVGVGLFGGAAVLVAMSPNFVILSIFCVLLGLGTGPHKAVAVPLLSDQYGDRTGRALGVMDTIGQFGGMVAPLAVVFFSTIFVWQGVFIFSALVSGVLAVMLVLVVRESSSLSLWVVPEERATNGGPQNETYLSTFADRRLLAFVFVATLFTFAWNGFSAFFPLLLTTEKGISPEFASIQYSLLFVASLSQTITGDVSDRIGRLEIGSVLLLLSFVGVFLLLFVEHAIVIAALTLAIGVGFHGFRPVRDSHLMDLIPGDVGGGTLGIIRTVATGVGALSPAAVGALSDTVSFTAAYALLGAVIAIGFVVTALLYVSRPS